MSELLGLFYMVILFSVCHRLSSYILGSRVYQHEQGLFHFSELFYGCMESTATAGALYFYFSTYSS